MGWEDKRGKKRKERKKKEARKERRMERRKLGKKNTNPVHLLGIDKIGRAKRYQPHDQMP